MKKILWPGCHETKISAADRDVGPREISGSCDPLRQNGRRCVICTLTSDAPLCFNLDSLYPFETILLKRERINKVQRMYGVQSTISHFFFGDSLGATVTEHKTDV